MPISSPCRPPGSAGSRARPFDDVV
jgi:hypothetical protein